MLNEIEEAVIACLKDTGGGLPSDNSKLWYVPEAHIRRQPPDLSGSLNQSLPAVCFANVDFTTEEKPFEHIGELRKEDEMTLIEKDRTKFELLYHLDIWTQDINSANEIVQKAIVILRTIGEQMFGLKENYQITEMKLLAGRSVPEERDGVYRRQLDYFIRSEIITETRLPAIREIFIKKVD
jgi:hypothetical protein